MEKPEFSDQEIKEMAEEAGWSSTYTPWWDQEIPRHRRFIEIVDARRRKEDGETHGPSGQGDDGPVSGTV